MNSEWHVGVKSWRMTMTAELKSNCRCRLQCAAVIHFSKDHSPSSDESQPRITRRTTRMMNTGAVVKWMGVVIFMVDVLSTRYWRLWVAVRRAAAPAAAKNEGNERDGRNEVVWTYDGQTNEINFIQYLSVRRHDCSMVASPPTQYQYQLSIINAMHGQWNQITIHQCIMSVGCVHRCKLNQLWSGVFPQLYVSWCIISEI